MAARLGNSWGNDSSTETIRAGRMGQSRKGKENNGESWQAGALAGRDAQLGFQHKQGEERQIEMF